MSGTNTDRGAYDYSEGGVELRVSIVGRTVEGNTEKFRLRVDEVLGSSVSAADGTNMPTGDRFKKGGEFVASREKGIGPIYAGWSLYNANGELI